MIKKILSLFSAPIKPRNTVDEVLAAFNKTVDDLKVIAAERETEAAQLRHRSAEQIADANVSSILAHNATSEAERALTVAKRIEDLTV